MKHFFSSLYLNSRLFWIGGGLATALFFSFYFPILFPFLQFGVVLLGLATVADIAMLYRSKEGFFAKRQMAERLSNGDDNPILLYLENRYAFPVSCELIDEIPFQFQKRDFLFDVNVNARASKELQYYIRPTQRGEYDFGALNIFLLSPFRLIKKRYVFEENRKTVVYPSYIQMKKYEMLAISQRLTEYGLKKIRRLGHTTEFEQIKPYVSGDDYRTVNWKASARSSQLMVNQYTDEKAQNVYCLIDKSRNMKMPFAGLSLLDYAINTSLVLCNIALHKQDKAGLITFAEKIHQTLPASNTAMQMNLVLETLYHQSTKFQEADFERLYIFIKRKITQRSLLILYTNFESISSLQRQLPFLRKIAHHHLLLVVFFENTELKELIFSQPRNTEEVYVKAIGENFSFEKRQIVRELELAGIYAVLTPPENVTINTINKYLELKARGKI